MIIAGSGIYVNAGQRLLRNRTREAIDGDEGFNRRKNNLTRSNICRLNSRGFEACSTSIENDNEFNKHSKDNGRARTRVHVDLPKLSRLKHRERAMGGNGSECISRVALAVFELDDTERRARVFRATSREREGRGTMQRIVVRGTISRVLSRARTMLHYQFPRQPAHNPLSLAHFAPRRSAFSSFTLADNRPREE